MTSTPTQITYTVLEYDPELTERIVVPLQAAPLGGNTGPFAVVDAARHFWDHYDGWEMSWPLVFLLFGDDGEEAGRFRLNQDSEPVFYAETVNP